MTTVADFGARGDGVTDDTEAIQHAIDETCGEVLFGRGVFRITQPILIDLSRCGFTSLRGKSGTAVIRSEVHGPAIILKGTHGGSADPTSFQPAVWLNERMPIVADLEITGIHPDSDGIQIIGVMEPTITGVLLRRLRHGVHVTGRARNVLIDHCHIYHNLGIGVYLDRVNLHQTIISSSHISYCRLGGIRVEASEIRNLQITGNDIEYNNNRAHGVPDADDEPTAEIFLDARQGSIREGTICSNTLQATYSPGGANIRMIGQGSEQHPKAGMWTIAGNLIGSQWNNIHLTSVQGVTITGNYVYSGHNRNLLCEDCFQIVVGSNCFGHNPDYGEERELCTGVSFYRCRDSVFTGNILQDCQTGRHRFPDVPELQREALLEFYDCQNFTVADSQILDSAPYGIRLVNSSEMLLSGLTVADRRTDLLMRSAIFWTGESRDSMITSSRLGPSLEQLVRADSELLVANCILKQPQNQ